MGEKKPIMSVGAFVNDIGLVEYEVNGAKVQREDFIALQLARIAAGLEASDDDEGEGKDDDEGSSDNIFGV